MTQQDLAIQQRKLSPELIIRIICIVYGAYFIFRNYSLMDSYLDLIPRLSSYGLKAVFILMFLFLVPLSLVLLWVKEKGGWIMLMFDMAYSLLSSLYLNIKISWMFFENSGANVSMSGPSVWLIVLTLFMVVGIIIGLTRKDVLAMYRISKANIITVVILGIAVFAYMRFL